MSTRRSNKRHYVQKGYGRKIHDKKDQRALSCFNFIECTLLNFLLTSRLYYISQGKYWNLALVFIQVRKRSLGDFIRSVYCLSLSASSSQISQSLREDTRTGSAVMEFVCEMSSEEGGNVRNVTLRDNKTIIVTLVSNARNLYNRQSSKKLRSRK